VLVAAAAAAVAAAGAGDISVYVDYVTVFVYIFKKMCQSSPRLIYYSQFPPRHSMINHDPSISRGNALTLEGIPFFYQHL
jgi:hypothetical protein